MNDPQQLFDREERVSAAFMWLVMLGLLFIAYTVFGKAILESPRAATVMKSVAMNYFPPLSTNPAITITTFPSPPGAVLFSVESVDGRIYGSTNGVNWSAIVTKEEAESGAYSTNIVGCGLSGESVVLFKSTP